ncbi:MAG: hypothetical protein M4579_005838 [Chaenotheca gracillima]|nr:MAG: hypothetical protein M4579_005838 [Chaenotheca gracillima]
MAASQTINVLISSFPGLKLPSTFCLQSSASSPISELYSRIEDGLPSIPSRLIITTTSNKQLTSSSPAPISSLISSDGNSILPLRLSVPLCGGKGGFGSQLRAAGGRMSSRRKRNQGENNGSNRNLDGRRIRTVNEAKALAEYLAVKPEMEKKEKEARVKRWEQIVEMAEEKEEELRTGAKAKMNAQMTQWVQDHDEMVQRTRENAQRAAQPALDSDGTARAEDAAADPSLSRESPPTGQGRANSKLWGGWDEDDDDFTSDSEAESDSKAGNQPRD